MTNENYRKVLEDSFTGIEQTQWNNLSAEAVFSYFGTLCSIAEKIHKLDKEEEKAAKSKMMIQEHTEEIQKRMRETYVREDQRENTWGKGRKQ